MKRRPQMKPGGEILDRRYRPVVAWMATANPYSGVEESPVRAGSEVESPSWGDHISSNPESASRYNRGATARVDGCGDSYSGLPSAARTRPRSAHSEHTQFIRAGPYRHRAVCEGEETGIRTGSTLSRRSAQKGSQSRESSLQQCLRICLPAHARLRRVPAAETNPRSRTILAAGDRACRETGNGRGCRPP